MAENKKASFLQSITGTEDFEERRKTARLDMAIEVRYCVLGEGVRSLSEGRAEPPRRGRKDARTKNVSAGGCLLLTKEELPVNSQLELQIFLDEGEHEALTLQGRIARLNREGKGSYEYGIAFDELSKEARRLFADYFFAKMYDMIGLSEWPTNRKVKGRIDSIRS